MQGSTMWRLAMLAVGVVVLAGCEPAPPLEVVTEPDFSTGVTVNPVAGPSPAPVTGTEITEVPLSTATTDEPVVSDNFDEVIARGPLTERLPNTCKLQNYQQYVGQNAAVLPGAALDRAWRVVGPDAIVTQEYNPARLNFRTNGAGTIQRVICG